MRFTIFISAIYIASSIDKEFFLNTDLYFLCMFALLFAFIDFIKFKYRNQ